MDRVSASFYVGLVVKGSRCEPEFRTVLVPHFFLTKLSAVNSERKERDEKDRALQEKIQSLRKKVYASRTFPPLLRAIILERDNHCCQNCLRGKDVLRKLGLHLEVDHIIAVIDEGLTTYDNGVTLCNECNSAKHHGKEYFGAKLQLMQK